MRTGWPRKPRRRRHRVTLDDAFSPPYANQQNRSSQLALDKPSLALTLDIGSWLSVANTTCLLLSNFPFMESLAEGGRWYSYRHVHTPTVSMQTLIYLHTDSSLSAYMLITSSHTHMQITSSWVRQLQHAKNLCGSTVVACCVAGRDRR